MGDPRKRKKKYETPTHPWQKDRIDDERELKRKYGLKNKKEIWKAQSMLRNIRGQARTLLGVSTEQSKKETEDLMLRLRKLSILKEDADLDHVLGLSIQDVLDRRFQSLVVRKGLAVNANQARQMIVHGHIVIGGRRVTAPSYLVTAEEEELITYAAKSPFVGRKLEAGSPVVDSGARFVKDQQAEAPEPAEEPSEEPKEADADGE
jgi:small subunit ribosomal protein S4